MTDDARREIEATRARLAELEAKARRPPTLAELQAMTPDQIADRLATSTGRAAIASTLTGSRPPGPLTPHEVADIVAGRITDPELVADHWDELARYTRETPK